VAFYWSPVSAFSVDIFYFLALCKSRVRIPETTDHIFHLSQPASYWCLHILCKILHFVDRASCNDSW